MESVLDLYLYREERMKFYKLLVDRVYTNYHRLHYLYDYENSKIISNDEWKMIRYDYDFANPVMQVLFPKNKYEYLESNPGYFWIQARKYNDHTGYNIVTSENKVTVNTSSGTISISFHSRIASFLYTNNRISNRISYDKEIWDPGDYCSYIVPKRVNIPANFTDYLFSYKTHNSDNISDCLYELSNLKYLTEDKTNLIEFTDFLYKNLKELKGSSPMNIFFNWTKFAPLSSIYINWIALSIDQSFIRIKRRKYQRTLPPSIFIPCFSVEIATTYYK